MLVQEKVVVFLPRGNGFDAPWKIEFPPYDGVAMLAQSMFRVKDRAGNDAGWFDFAVTLFGSGRHTVEIDDKYGTLQRTLNEKHGTENAPSVLMEQMRIEAAVADAFAAHSAEILDIIRKTGKAL